MENILLVINIILAILLVVFVLFQKSEGGALGIGVSQDTLCFQDPLVIFLQKQQQLLQHYSLFVVLH